MCAASEHSVVGEFVGRIGIATRSTLMGVAVGVVGGWSFGLLFALLLHLLHGESQGIIWMSLAFLRAGLMAGVLAGLALGLCEVIPPRSQKMPGSRRNSKSLETELFRSRLTAGTSWLHPTRN